jgi:thioredoxin-related protein
VQGTRVQRIFQGLSLSVIILTFITVPVFGSPAPKQEADERLLTINLQEVFSAKISLKPFVGVKAMTPIAEVSSVKAGETTAFKIPAKYLPGEFLLRIDYRAKEAGYPRPAEKSIFINKENIELSVNPLHIHDSEYTKFNQGETENTAYSAFIKENIEKRMPIESLRQFLLSYDRQKSKLYTHAVKEFKERRQEYNTWLGNQTKKHSKLYVSNLFQFQYIPAIEWPSSLKEGPKQLLKNYFKGIDFSNPLIIRSRELTMFMDDYMRLYGTLATTGELRNSLFTEAGRIACEKASKGDPKVYGWMADYFYNGYETYNIKDGMVMLGEHIKNPNCLATKKEEIIERLEGMARLTPGALSPDFVSIDKEGNDFEFHKWKANAQYKLLLFSLTGCGPCKRLKKELTQWHDDPKNKEKLDIIVVYLNKTKTEAERQKTAAALPPDWKYTYVKKGLTSSAAKAYAVSGVPAMFLIDSKNNTIVSAPDNFDQLIKKLGYNVKT